jgi:hypothetical protein
MRARESLMTQTSKARIRGKISLQGVLLVLVALVVVVAVAGGELWQSSNFTVSRQYLFENRPSLDFSHEDLSQDWTEADLKARFASATFDCYRNGDQLGTRACDTYIGSHNGAPAMVGVFYFADGRLAHASILVPWWRHGAMFKALVSRYGSPTAVQNMTSGNVPLFGWKLVNGSGLFYNRERSAKPFEYNLVFWTSARKCEEHPCFSSAQ